MTLTVIELLVLLGPDVLSQYRTSPLAGYPKIADATRLVSRHPRQSIVESISNTVAAKIRGYI